MINWELSVMIRRLECHKGPVLLPGDAVESLGSNVVRVLGTSHCGWLCPSSFFRVCSPLELLAFQA